VDIRVWGRGAEWRLEGSWPDLEAANRFLEHLRVRSFASATVRAYAYDVLCFARFCAERGLRLAEVVPADLFDWIAWQAESRRPAAGNVVRLTRHAGAAPSSVNRRVAAVRALFEHQVVLGARAENPVPAPRRGQGLRAKSRGVLGHLGPGRPRGGGRLVRAPQRLPDALDAAEVAAFLADLRTHRDRAITLAMLLGGLRAGEVRALKLTDVDQGLRRLRVCGKGGRERVVPVDRAFFS
jgi:integrase/recombinase XerC